MSIFFSKFDANLLKTHYTNNEIEVLHINDTRIMKFWNLIVVGPKTKKTLDMI